MSARAKIVINISELITALLVFTLSLYTLTHCKIYNLAITLLNIILPFKLSEIIIFAALLSLILILCAVGGEKAYVGVYYLSWILLVPSVLWFSKMDWFKVIGFPVDFEILATDLSQTQIFITGLILVGGRIFFYFSSRIKDLRLELLTRGASQQEVEKVAFKNFIFSIMLIILCMVAVFTIWAITPISTQALQAWLETLPYPYMILGLTATFTLTICITIFLRSRAKTRKSPNQTPK